MSNNFQPSEDIFDDVEGHAMKPRGIETPVTDDVEGHALRGKGGIETDDDEDVEGHGVRVRI